MRRQREQVGPLAHGWKFGPAEHLHRGETLQLPERQLHHLGEAREVCHHKDALLLPGADEGQHAAVLRVEEFQRAAAEGPALLALGDQPPHPPQQRVRIAMLRLHIYGFVVILRVDDHRQVEALRIGAREARVAVARPLHGGAHAIAVAEVEVVSHSDLVAVIDDRRARQREQQRVHQLDAAPVVFEQRRETAADAEVDARLLVVGVDARTYSRAPRR